MRFRWRSLLWQLLVGGVLLLPQVHGELILFDAEATLPIPSSHVRYAQLAEAPEGTDGQVLDLKPSPWNSPALFLKDTAWRQDATQYAYVELSIWFGAPYPQTYQPKLSFWGYFCGPSEGVELTDFLPDPCPVGEWVTVSIPTEAFSSAEKAPNAIEWLYFGTGQNEQAVLVRDVILTDTAPVPEVPLPSPNDNPVIPEIHILSAEWIVAVMDPSSSFLKQMDRLTAGQYQRLVERNRQADTDNNMPEFWVTAAELRNLRTVFAQAARKGSLEGQCGKADYFRISSPMDAAYGTIGKEPSALTLHYVSVDEGKAALGDIRYGIYAYLKLPSSLRSGHTYTLRLGDGTEKAFTFDENVSISRAIKVSQVGYRPGNPANTAYLGAWLGEAGALTFPADVEFTVVDAASGRSVHTGALTERVTHALRSAEGWKTDGLPDWTGERLYAMDLSPLRAPGSYYIRIPGVGRSWAFEVKEDAYGEAFYTAARGLFHQRAGTALEAAQTAWNRPAVHNGPIYASEMIPYWADTRNVIRSTDGARISWPRFDIIGATIDTSKNHGPIEGGWFDAADFDRNLFHYAAILDLLALYEMAPERFTDGQLNLPESGNGIPDLLDEAVFGLKVWRASQLPNGGVAGMVESWTHPDPNDSDALYAFSRRTPQASLLYSGSAAKLARLLQPFAPSLARGYLETALAAFAFAEDPAHTVASIEVPAASERGKGEPYTVAFTPPEGFLAKYQLFAQTQLYLTTGDRAYLGNLAELYASCPPPYAWPLSMQDFSPWLTYDLIAHPGLWWENEAVPPAMREKIFNDLLVPAVHLLPHGEATPYRQTWPLDQDYWLEWGASDHTNQIRALAIANELSPSPDFEKAITHNLHYMFGCNPLGMSWTTGIGEVYPVSLQHAISQSDDHADPVPGLTVYGITTWHVYPQFRDLMEPFHRLPDPYPVGRRWAAHPYLNTVQNEFTVHESIASTIFALGYCLVEGWMPSPELKARKPLPLDQLNGFWYLP